MDFAALPPEVNSGRMYAGAGVGPLVSAAAAWDALAAELSSAAASYRAIVSELTGGSWAGPSSSVMAAAAAPYVSWMNTTAAQAQQTAGQLGAAVAAYEAAFAATVPPPQIEVNRALLASLVATNILGQNTPAIAATEAQYAEMWAQDAAAMYGYAGASAAATRLTPFAAPKQTTNTNGTAMQANAVNQAAQSATGPSTQSALNTVPNMLQNISAGSIVNPSNLDPGLGNLFGPSSGPTGLNELTQNIGNWALVISGPLFTASGITPLMGGLYGLALPTAVAVAGDVSPADAGLGTLANSPVSGSLGNAGVSAGLGESATVGKLSVPQAWADSPAVRLASSASPLSTAGLGGVPQAEAAAPGGFFGIPPVGSLVNAPRGEQTRARSGAGQKVVPTGPAGPGTDERAPVPAAAAQRPRKHVASALSEREREELEKLRKEISEVATERDAAARLIKEAML
ncbi:hypothetical protein A5675_26085 [Mycobacterium malmoense]|uniref:PPE family protein n=1 Tax=Mycobacterium malmoense TaxID=1780 RepID=UPI00080BA59D|nr:PPE family protein [Mycobacterium malmoense]OCB19150.1 hypothetical protein A5674_07430 [Mycobacterium malmoense]OCB31626.1 hypothetical protein A5675_26085 [Mycobacterium malmoense]